MKLLFLTAYELEEVAEKIIYHDTKGLIVCKTAFSEEQDTDVIQFSNDEISQDIAVSGFIPQLNHHYGVTIQSYDVYEIGDLGEGFAFVIN